MDSHAEWELRATAALNWLRRSIDATGGQGSAHSWHPLLGWGKAYPETTGYIIPTFFDYAAIWNDERLKALAFSCANWLTTIQLPSGAFPGLLVENTSPSIFNSTQILFGLTRAAQEDPANDTYRHAVQRCCDWLIAMLAPDYSWKKYAFVPGFTPSYYSRAVWGLVCANDLLQDQEVSEKMQKAMQHYASLYLNTLSLRDWGFKPGQPAFTHTIAYTLEGFLALAVAFQDAGVLQQTIRVAEQLLAVRSRAGKRTAGRYDELWQGDYSFICVTGNAQLSLFYQRLFERTRETKYQNASAEILAEVIGCQVLKGNLNRVGALPGSAPIWGAYLPFRYPNWAAKFFLDAILPYLEHRP